MKEKKIKLRHLKEMYARNNYNYQKMMEIPGFPDKTLFIKEIFNNKFKKMLITAPYNFSKGIDISLLERFVKIRRNIDGSVKNREESQNYDFFKNNNFRIYQEQECFQQNFANYPIINVSFKFNFDCNFYQMVEKYRIVLNALFTKYKYLLKFNKLDAEEINQFKKYYNRNLYKILSKTEIIEGLSFLAECFSKYFNGRKVFLFIDNYDFPINKILINDAFDSVHHVYDFFNQILANSLNSKYVERAVLTGVHCYDIFGPFEADNVGKYLFLDSHPFTQYLGLTQTEFDNYLINFHANDTEKREYQQHCDAYVDANGTNLFSNHSILSLLIDRRTEESRKYLRRQFTLIPIIRYVITKLCSNQSVIIQIIKKFQIQHVIEFRKILSRNPYYNMTQLEKPDLFLNFILHEGWLSYEKSISNDNIYKVKLINNYIIEKCQERLNDYYGMLYRIRNYEKEGNKSINYLNECTESFEKIFPQFEDDVIKDFASKFNKTIQNSGAQNEYIYHTLMFDILCKTQFLIGDNKLTFTDGKPDLIFHKENFGIVVQVTYEKSYKLDLKETIEKYRNIFNEQPCFKNVSLIMYMGLDIDKNFVVGMNVLKENRLIES